MNNPNLEEFDAIIIGGGPAGLSAANRLVQEGKKSLLINSTTAKGLPLGGLANEWDNQCAEFEDADFNSLDIFSTWPISHSEYRTYTEIAKKILGIEINHNNEVNTKTRNYFRDNLYIDEVETIISKKIKWEDLFLSTLQNPLVTIHNGSVTKINHNNKAINAIVLDGIEITMRESTKIYLAAGCVGNTELLTRSDFLALNESTVYSRYLADHPMFENIYLKGGNLNSFATLFENKKVNNQTVLKKRKYRVRKNGRNLGVFEIRHFFTHRSIKNTSDKLLLSEYLKGSVNKLFHIVFKRIIFRPLLTKVWIQLAQELNYNSRIVVENNLTSIIWKLKEEDLKNYLEVIEVIKFFAEEKGFVLYYSKNIEAVAELEDTALPAFHLSGTTRMCKKEADSVVDKNGKLNDIENCYILGSSVFPTPSWANPTLSIIALSIRTVEKSWLL
jgi:hypothetical protein